jgi:hypothetical protein
LWHQLARGDHALGGVASSSRRSSSNLRPSTPPAALSSSMATCRPRVMASPARADWPEKGGHEADLDGFLCQGRQCRQHSNND